MPMCPEVSLGSGYGESECRAERLQFAVFLGGVDGGVLVFESVLVAVGGLWHGP